jgi:hypothetical protein
MSINLQNFYVKSGSTFTTLNPFPIGYIYMSANDTSPASIYGGTWQALTDGRFLLPNGSWNSTGGANSHNHSDGDGLYALIGAVDSDIGTIAYKAEARYETVSYTAKVYGTSGRGGQDWPNVNHSTRVRGKVSTTSNIPQYRTCYCWYRSA